LTVACRIAKLCRLMQPDLPHIIEPTRLARAGQTLAGQYAIEEMSRLGERLFDKSGLADFRLEFERDEELDITFITGEISAKVSMICQRCLEPMTLALKCPVYLGVINNSVDLSILPDSCEPLYEDDSPVSLRDLVEDELILALPLSAMHEMVDCEAGGLLNEVNKSVKESPFSVLKTLVKNQTNNNRRR